MGRAIGACAGGMKPVQGFFDFVKSLGAARMAAMAAVTLAMIGFFSFLMVRMTTPQMVPPPHILRLARARWEMT